MKAAFSLGAGRVRSPLVAVLAMGVAVLGSLASVSVAQGQSFSQFAQICPDGSGAGQCLQPLGLETSPLDGHLFVSDSRNNRIEEFTPWGEFVKAYGWGVVASGPGNKPKNEIERVTASGTGGSFKLRYQSRGGVAAVEVTFPLQPGTGPTAGEIQSALIAAPPQSSQSDPFGPGDISVSGPPGGPWDIEFIGRYADTNFGEGIFHLEADGTGLTGPGAAAAVTTVQDGGNYEICVPADGDVCRDGSPGGNPGELAIPAGLAIDSSGDLYVVDRENHRVEKFDSDGNFLLMFGGEVNETTGEDVCTEAQISGGDVCGRGVTGNPGPGEGQFGPWTQAGNTYTGDYIDVGPDGAVYVGDTNRIQKFSPNGAFEAQIAGAVAGETVQSLAVSGTGDIYADFVVPGEASFRSKANVRRLDASGSPLAELEAPNPRGVETDSAGNVFVFDGNGSGAFAGRVLGFTAAGSPVDLDSEAPGNALGDGGALKDVGALATSSPPVCGLKTTSLYVGTSLLGSTQSSIKLYGDTPDPTICPQPAAAPTINAQFATSVDSGSATLRARINPHFWPDARFYVEYGVGKCSEGGCNRTQPSSPGSLLTSKVANQDFLSSAVVIPGLQPGTTYHYRFVVQSGGGGPVRGEEVTFRTARLSLEEGGCPNDVFRVGASASLPDCRAYELVSPLDKASSDVSRRGENSLVQTDPSGQRLAFSSSRSFADAEGGPLVSQYLAHRGSAGWSTDSISPARGVPSLYPLGASTESNFFKALSPDLCSGWVVQDSIHRLTENAPVNVPNLYRRNNCGGGYEAVTTSLPPGWGPIPYGTYYFPTVQGFSDDGSRTVFRANAALAVSAGSPHPPFACIVKGQPSGNTYRWLRDGEPIPGATSPVYTYRAADAGKVVQCQVTSTQSGKTSLVTSEILQVEPAPSVPPASPGFKGEAEPDLPGTPTISGAPAVGSTLTCTPGEWQGSPAFSYQWFAGDSAIAGATESTYDVLPADRDASIQCRLTGTNAGGAAVSFSRSVTIEADMPRTVGGPQLTGTAEAGQALVCDPGAWLGSPSFTYQWLRNGAVIGGAASSEYTLVAADEGTVVQCRVAASNSEATTVATSPRRSVAPAGGTAPATLTAAGGIDGSGAVGETLTCEPGTWLGSPTFTYQWLRNGAAIGGAASAKYTLVAADQGAAIQCEVTATNGGGAVVAVDGDPVYAAPVAAPQRVITTNGNYQLYVSEGSTLRLVSVLPNGSVTDSNAAAGTSWSLGVATNSHEDQVYRSVSADGSRVFWSATGGSGTGPGKLYLRLNATEPQSPIAAGRCKDPAKACTIPISGSTEASFVTANPEGTRTLYLDEAGPGSEPSLYSAEIEEGGGEVVSHPTLIAEGVLGVMGASEDATRVYFVSEEALTSAPNSEGDQPVAGQPNVYLSEAGAGIEFVATIAPKDAEGGHQRAGAGSPPTPVAATPSRHTSRVSPDGLHLAFTSIATPTGYDNGDAASEEADAEVFLYDARAGGGAGKLLCVSCNPSRARPAGRLVHAGVSGTQDDIWAAATLPGWSSEYQPTRALSGDGKRVFFEAYAPLVPGDSNGRADVYQWEAPGAGSCTEASASFSEDNQGCIRLISSGQSVEDAEFLDATPDGSDVFFITQASLVPDDYGFRDVYDARVGGGFAPREPIGQGCQGEACQSPPAPPIDATPASSSFAGPGNVKEQKPRRCRKARHKVRRSGKSVCVKKKKKASAKKHAKRARNHRGGIR